MKTSRSPFDSVAAFALLIVTSMVLSCTTGTSPPGGGGREQQDDVQVVFMIKDPTHKLVCSCVCNTGVGSVDDDVDLTVDVPIGGCAGIKDGTKCKTADGKEGTIKGDCVDSIEPVDQKLLRIAGDDKVTELALPE